MFFLPELGFPCKTYVYSLSLLSIDITSVFFFHQKKKKKKEKKGKERKEGSIRMHGVCKKFCFRYE